MNVIQITYKTLLFLYLESPDKKISKIVPQLTEQEKTFFMLEICDASEIEDFYALNVNKVKLFCAFAILYGKESMKISEFVKLLIEIFRLVFKNDLYSAVMDEFNTYAETNCDDNLFESYKDFDLRFLKGKATIFFLSSQKEGLIR